VRDGRWHRRVQGVVPHYFFHRGEVARALRAGFLRGELLLAGLCTGSKSVRFFHNSSGFLKQDGKNLARAMQFPAYGVGRLLGERGDLFVAQLLIGDEQQQQAVFV